MSKSSTNESIVTAYGFSYSSCGYCGDPNTSYSYGMHAYALSCHDYQDLVDAGWRRSGCYLYKPHMRETCCPQYTIRLDATKFSASKSQRKIIGKFNRFLQGTWVPSGADDDDAIVNNRPQSKSKKEAQKEFNLSEAIHTSEEHEGWKHQFKVVMEPSSVTEEKFNLFKKYQTIIHKEPLSKVSERGYERFLVETPLKIEPSPKNTEPGYGSYHQCYYLDGKLLAVAVLDILPRFVSSVYFMYDPDYSFLGLGKYSALREISLTNELREDGREELKYYYMGYYIHSCPKMRYKGQYRPSYLCDPITKEWHPFEKWIPELEKNPFSTFATQTPTTAEKKQPPPGMLNASSLTYDDIAHVPVYVSREMRYVKLYVKDEPSLKENEERINELKEHVAAVGKDLAAKMVYIIGMI